MKKFILPCIAVMGIYGQFAMASTAPTSGPAPTFSAAGPATGVTQDAPYQLAKLQGEVKTLQGQVQTLLSQSQMQNDESGTNLDDIGMGG
jgi:TolA-binding protein